MASNRRIYLVSCVKTKLSYRAPAQDLYTSPWFKKARAYVLKSGSPWFILSTEYHLVSPDDVIDTYEKTFQRVAEWRDWAEKVQGQMEQMLPPADEVVIFAGANYRKHLKPYLHSRFPIVSAPLAHLRNGEQMKWLSENEPD